MTPMHPHWQSTEDEQIVPVRSKESARQPIRVSRAPAAIVGIGIMIAAVTYSFGGLGTLIGQLTNPTPDVTVSIKQSGVDPAIATIKPGQTVKWINEDQIPHVLSSENVPTEDGKPFTTPAMFQGSDAYYTAPLNAAEGTYDYISETSDQISGQIIISLADGAVSSSSSSVAVVEPTVSSVPIVVTTSSSVGPAPLPTTQTSSSITPSPVGANVIAVNPHVVGAKKSSSSTSSKKPAVTDHKPKTQTKSGPAVWIVIACSIAALAVATKGAFRKV